MTLVLLVAEPMHPVGLACLLIAAMVAWAARAVAGATGMAIGLGVLIAALTLTNVNLGALAAVAVLAAAALTLPELRGRLALRRGAVGLLVLAPLAILGPDLGTEWVQKLLIAVEGGVIATAVTVLGTSGADGETRAFRWLALLTAAAVMSALVIAMVTVALGASLGGLVDGVVVEPSKLRDVFVIPFALPDAAVADVEPVRCI
jgi:hypothetical protein